MSTSLLVTTAAGSKAADVVAAVGGAAAGGLLPPRDQAWRIPSSAPRRVFEPARPVGPRVRDTRDLAHAGRETRAKVGAADVVVGSLRVVPMVLPGVPHGLDDPVEVERGARVPAAPCPLPHHTGIDTVHDLPGAVQIGDQRSSR